MFHKIVTTIVIVPLAAIIIAFAIANRQLVTVSFDPFSTVNPAYAATLPLFLMIFVLVILGVIVGGMAAWLRQSKWRRTARKLDAEVRTLHQELDSLRQRAAAYPPPPPQPTFFDPTVPERPAIAPPVR